MSPPPSVAVAAAAVPLPEAGPDELGIAHKQSFVDCKRRKRII